MPFKPRRGRRAFDMPYIATIGYSDNDVPFVWYQLLPASLYSHRVNVVYLHIRVNEEDKITIPSEHFHCVRCKIMGTVKTLQEYTCV